MSLALAEAGRWLGSRSSGPGWVTWWDLVSHQNRTKPQEATNISSWEMSPSGARAAMKGQQTTVSKGMMGAREDISSGSGVSWGDHIWACVSTASALVVPSPKSNSWCAWRIRHPLAPSHLVCMPVSEQTFGLWLSDCLLPWVHHTVRENQVICKEAKLRECHREPSGFLLPSGSLAQPHLIPWPSPCFQSL